MALKKESAFDLKKQQNNLESKIIVAFERISEVFRVLLWNQAQSSGLSPIQIQILIFIRHHPPELSKVSYLSREFNLTKATVSDSVRVLVKKELLQRTADPEDSRSHVLTLTESGKKQVTEVEGYIQDLRLPLLDLGTDKKEVLLSSLLELIFKLQRNGILDIQRMCYTCKHYQGNRENKHHCALLNEKLNAQSLRVDCPEHEAAA